MSNGAKLILVVLSFFLALTYVRAYEVSVKTNEVIFPGSEAVAYSLSIYNSSGNERIPQFIADGPFHIELRGSAEEYVLPPLYARELSIYLRADPKMNPGDEYRGQIRVLINGDSLRVPLTLKGGPAPLFPITGTGLVGFALPTVGIVNGMLLVIVVILVIALVARIKNRWGK